MRTIIYFLYVSSVKHISNLPSNNVKKAWQKVLFLHKNFNILNLGLTEIALRNSNQILGKVNVDKKQFFKEKIS